MDETTQLKIETFLMNQAQILMDKTLAKNKTGNTISENKSENNKVKGIFVKNKIDHKLVKHFIDSESDFKKLVTNYKSNINIKEVCLNNTNPSPDHIIYSMETKLIISYSYGRFLRVLSNFQLINNETKLLHVALSLGIELISEYLFLSYKLEKTEKWTFWNGKDLIIKQWYMLMNTNLYLH